MSGIEVATGELTGHNAHLIHQSNFANATKEEIRNAILVAEQQMAQIPGALFGDNDVMPLTHHYSPGLYCREIFIPARMLVVGKIHKHEHPNTLMKGTVSVLTETGGVEIIEGPKFMISPPGTKRLLYTHTDTVWITYHLNPNNLEFGEELEDEIIAKDYSEFQKFIEDQKCLSEQ